MSDINQRKISNKILMFDLYEPGFSFHGAAYAAGGGGQGGTGSINLSGLDVGSGGGITDYRYWRDHPGGARPGTNGGTSIIANWYDMYPITIGDSTQNSAWMCFAPISLGARGGQAPSQNGESAYYVYGAICGGGGGAGGRAGWYSSGTGYPSSAGGDGGFPGGGGGGGGGGAQNSATTFEPANGGAGADGMVVIEWW